jgi:tetratricopeptide (TPR) repeat protein
MPKKPESSTPVKEYFLANKNWVFLLVIILIAIVLVYYKSLFNGLIDWDDYEYITRNNFLNNLSWNNIVSIYKSDKHITLSLLTIAVQIKFTGLNPYYFHLLNIILHCANIILVYILAKKLSKNQIITIIATALFALHPTRVESVAWVMQRKDLLYTLFYLISLVTYIFYIEKKEKKFYLILIVVVSAWLSSISKIQALTLPFALCLFDYYYGRRFSLLLVLEKIILFVVCLIFPSFSNYFLIFLILLFFTNNLLTSNLRKLFIKYDLKQKILILVKKYLIIRKSDRLLRKIANFILLYINALIIFILLRVVFFKIVNLLPNISGYWAVKSNGIRIISDFNFFDRIFLFCYSVVFYLYQLFNPFNLCAMHPYPIKINGNLPFEYYAAGVILLLICSLILLSIIKSKADKKVLILGFIFFLINIFMVGHILPIEGRLVAADRYSYLAYFGLFFLVGFFLNKIIEKRHLIANKLIFISLILLLSGYSIYSYSRVSVWKSTYTFWSDVVKKQPDNYYAYYGVGNFLLEANDYEKAIEFFKKAELLNNKDPMVYNNLGLAYYSFEEYNEAINNFSKAVDLAPEFSQGYNNRGNAYYYLKDFDKAMKDYEMAYAKWNKNTDALINKADLEVELNNFDSALYDYKLCIKIDSNNALPYQRIGVFYLKQNNFESAIIFLKKALKIKPDFTKAQSALAFAESKVSQGLNQNPEVNKNNNAEYFINQGLIKAKSNDFTAALELFNKAISSDPLNSTAFKNRGSAKAALKDFIGSIDDFNSSIQINPNDAGAYLNRGNSKFQLNDKSCCDDWRKAQQLGNTRAGDMLLKHCK